MRHPCRFGTPAPQWAVAFTDAFQLIQHPNGTSPTEWDIPATLGHDILGRVRLKKTAALNDALVAIVYEDWRGDITGFVFTVHDLNKIDAPHRDPLNTAMGMVLGELIEPSTPGKLRNVELLEPLNNEFPGIRWQGNVP